MSPEMTSPPRTFEENSLKFQSPCFPSTTIVPAGLMFSVGRVSADPVVNDHWGPVVVPASLTPSMRHE